MTDYTTFLQQKAIRAQPVGRECADLHPALFDFQRDIVRWAVHRGRAAIFADCGMGKTLMQLEWARQTRDACAKYGVPFHFKQWCGADAEGLAGERDKKGKIHLPVLDGVQHAGSLT